MTASISTPFDSLSYHYQTIIFGRVSQWLNYKDIKHLVSAFALLNQRANVETITLTVKDCLESAILYFKRLEEKEKYLTSRLDEILLTQDTALTQNLFHSAIIMNIFQRIASEAHLQKAVNQSHLAVISGVLREVPISKGARAYAVLAALRRGHCEAATQLLEGNVSIWIGAFNVPEPFFEALQLAVEKNYPQVVDLLAQNEGPRGCFRGLAIFLAAQQGRLEMVVALLQNNAVIADGDRVAAIVESAERGHHAIAHFLIEQSDNNRGKALTLAAGKGFLKAVTFLLNSGSINDDHQIKAFNSAQKADHAQIISLLLKDSEVVRGAALRLYASIGLAAGINGVFRSGYISYHHRVIAIEVAARHCDEHIVSGLVGTCLLEEEDAGRIIKNAVALNKLSLVQVVLNHMHLLHRQIPKDDLVFAIALAEKKGYNEIVLELRRTRLFIFNPNPFVGIRFAYRKLSQWVSGY